MVRNLSQQQRKILAILPALQDKMSCKDVMTSRDVIAALSLEYTPSARASVSRSLTGLKEQGLIRHVYGISEGRQRQGYARAEPLRITVVNKRTFLRMLKNCNLSRPD